MNADDDRSASILPGRNSLTWMALAVALVGATLWPDHVSGSPADEAAASSTSPPPLDAAHAHNDYLHQRPLLDALDHGFTSVEADVFLVEGELWVAHTAEELQPGRTLEALYLAPLRERIQSSGGTVYPGGGRFQLLVDLKSDGAATYRALSALLAQYRDIITSVRDGQIDQRAVDVVVSGNRPVEIMAAESVRYAGVDGRLGDLDSELPPHLMPLISDRWGAHFQWTGEGEMPEAERRRLEEYVRRAHAAGRRIRFWATPETTAAWRVLHRAGVDHINTDDLEGLERFLRDADEPR